MDARVGGRYRIDNEPPDGRVVVIAGEFLVVEPPMRLEFTWIVDPPSGDAAPERVSCFEAWGAGTEVVVTHELDLALSSASRRTLARARCSMGRGSWMSRAVQAFA